jgi:hypothetical protein
MPRNLKLMNSASVLANFPLLVAIFLILEGAMKLGMHSNGV